MTRFKKTRGTDIPRPLLCPLRSVYCNHLFELFSLLSFLPVVLRYDASSFARHSSFRAVHVDKFVL